MRLLTIKDTLAFFLVMLLTVSVNDASAQLSGAKYVVLIGIDGLSPEGMQTASTPRMDDMRNTGAYTYQARSVRPTSSSPNWASMIMGAGPEQHGVTSNSWSSTNFTIAPVEEGVERIFPTMFSLLHAQDPDIVSAAIYEWSGISSLFEHSAVDIAIDTNDAEHTADVAITTLTEQKPTLTFIHFDHVDHAGHAYGWGSSEYNKAVTEADGYVDEIFESLESAAMLDETLVIIASDHGGVGTRHGGDSMAELETPWLMVGPGVEKDFKISQAVYIYDTAATIAAVLGVAQPYSWIGRPVLSAFEDGVLTANEEDIELAPQPVHFAISQNYPNPFGLETQFEVEVAKSQRLEVQLYDIEGKQIATLFNGVLAANQKRQIQVSGADLANGMYMIRFAGEQFTAVRKVVLLR